MTIEYVQHWYLASRLQGTLRTAGSDDNNFSPRKTWAQSQLVDVGRRWDILISKVTLQSVNCVGTEISHLNSIPHETDWQTGSWPSHHIQWRHIQFQQHVAVLWALQGFFNIKGKNVFSYLVQLQCSLGCKSPEPCIRYYVSRCL